MFDYGCSTSKQPLPFNNWYLSGAMFIIRSIYHSSIALVRPPPLDLSDLKTQSIQSTHLGSIHPQPSIWPNDRRVEPIILNAPAGGDPGDPSSTFTTEGCDDNAKPKESSKESSSTTDDLRVRFPLALPWFEFILNILPPAIMAIHYLTSKKKQLDNFEVVIEAPKSATDYQISLGNQNATSTISITLEEGKPIKFIQEENLSSGSPIPLYNTFWNIHQTDMSIIINDPSDAGLICDPEIHIIEDIKNRQTIRIIRQHPILPLNLFHHGAKGDSNDWDLLNKTSINVTNDPPGETSEFHPIPFNAESKEYISIKQSPTLPKEYVPYAYES